MKTICIPKVRGFNEYTNKIFWLPGGTFRFEHSLKAITKWEQRHFKPFLKNDPDRTLEEQLDYYYCMCLDTNFDERYLYLCPQVVKELQKYINTQFTATTIGNKGGKNSIILTSEVIYAYMALSHVPFTCDKWNIYNLLLVLGAIGELQSSANEPKKSEKDLAMEYNSQNKRLRAEFGLD